MALTFKQLTNWFIETGADSVAHTKNGYLAHAIGVYNDLKKWNLAEESARAGLFHSIYGTQQFQGFTFPVERRQEIRDMIGDHWEHICFLNCFMLRESLYNQAGDDKQTYDIEHRETRETMTLDRKTFDDLCTLHLCDWVEQVERSDMWDFNRQELRSLAERLGGVALASYDQVFAKEPV